MENKDNNNFGEPINNAANPDGKAGYRDQRLDNVSTKPLPSVPTTEREYSSGNPSPTEYGYEVQVVKEAVIGIRDSGPTSQLTTYPQLTTEDRLETGLGASVSLPDSELMVSLRRERSAKRPIPFAVLQGTNSLLPFGAAWSYATMASKDADVTAFNKVDLSILSRCSGRFRERAGIREVYAYKSFAEMKDSIISYRSRSIAYTNLPQDDMFLLEISREAALAQQALPLYAAKYARDYMSELTKRGLKFSPHMVSNLVDPEVNKCELILYSDLAGQKTFDPTLYMRLGVLTKLRESSAKVGPIGQFIQQDVVVTQLPHYVLRKVSQSGYFVTTADGAGRLGTAADSASYSLMDWVGLFLSGNRGRSKLLTSLTRAAQRVNDIINGYKIITGAIDTIEANRGAKFQTIGEFLPIKGKHHQEGNCFLDYLISGSQFSYFFKERFEHAPKVKAAEGVDGANNVLYDTNLATLTPALQQALTWSDAGSNSFQRPIGLYKGDDAWRTDEIAFIGIFRQITSNNEPKLSAGDAIGIALGFSFRSSAAAVSVGTDGCTADLTSGNIQRPANSVNWSAPDSAILKGESHVFVDAIYGDLYTPLLLMADTVGGVQAFNHVVINSPFYYVAGTDCSQLYTGPTEASSDYSWVPPICTQVACRADILSITQYNSQPVSMQAYTFSNAKASHNSAHASILFAYGQYLRVLNQLDLSEGGILTPASVAGQADFAVFNPQGYRGVEWYELSLTTVENTIVDAASGFTMTYKNNATIRADRDGGRSNQSSPPISIK